MRGPIGEQHGPRRRDRVDDADHRLLGDVTAPASRQREDERADQGGREPEGVRLPGVGLVSEQERRCRAQGGDLREGDVDEDDLAREHVDPEVRVDARQHQAHEEWCPQDRKELSDHLI